MIETKSLSSQIAHLDPCIDSHAWLNEQTSPEIAWQTCQRGDWMLWLIATQTSDNSWSDDRKPLLACCLDFVDFIAHLHTKITRDKTLQSICALRNWIAYADGPPYDAYRQLQTPSYSDNAASALADSASSAASEGAATPSAIVSSCNFYCAVNYAAQAIAHTSDNLITKSLADCANIVRKHFPKPPQIKRPV